MKDTDLMVGNYVMFRCDESMPHIAQMTSRNFFKLGETPNGVDPFKYFHIAPLELDEEWIECLGLHEIDIVKIEGIAKDIKTDYVHELQNIWYWVYHEQLVLLKPLDPDKYNKKKA